MAKTRLNTADRENIAEAIIAHKYTPLLAANRATEYALANEVYERVYPKDVQKKMAALGAGAFDTDDDLTVSVNGQRMQLHFDSKSRSFDELGRLSDRDVVRSDAVFRPFFAKHHGYHSPCLSVLDDDELGARIVQWQRERADLKSDRPAMLDKVIAALSQFRYFDDLITDFPEAQTFIMKRWRERPEGGSPGVPSVVIKDLARALDLPPELAEAA